MSLTVFLLSIERVSLTSRPYRAILAFPGSFKVLGMAGGTIATLLIGVGFLYFISSSHSSTSPVSLEGRVQLGEKS